ncbi:hypothetical protein lerEdw1_007936 [Lerista edwardsae]|nr:hypothetical protein lerEdw1_007936 [Lerista edwardsae]
MGRPGSPPPPPPPENRCPLWALPEEPLLLICSYLDARALGRLGQTCRRLWHFTSRNVLWRRLARSCLNAGFSALGADLAGPRSLGLEERKGTVPDLSALLLGHLPRLRHLQHGVARSAMSGQWPIEHATSQHLPESLMPWMQLDDDYLYLSQAEDIQVWLRPNGTSLQRCPQAVFSGHQEDVCRFVLANDYIVSGGGDGNIVLHKLNESFSFKFLAHEQEVNCVDCQGGIIVTGSRDRTAKVSSLHIYSYYVCAWKENWKIHQISTVLTLQVWSLSPGRAGQCLHTIQTEDRVWSIAISPLSSWEDLEATLESRIQASVTSSMAEAMAQLQRSMASSITALHNPSQATQSMPQGSQENHQPPPKCPRTEARPSSSPALILATATEAEEAHLSDTASMEESAKEGEVSEEEEPQEPERPKSHLFSPLLFPKLFQRVVQTQDLDKSQETTEQEPQPEPGTSQWGPAIPDCLRPLIEKEWAHPIKGGEPHKPNTRLFNLAQEGYSGCPWWMLQ